MHENGNLALFLHQAVAQAQQYITQGCGWMIDLEKFSLLMTESLKEGWHEKAGTHGTWPIGVQDLAFAQGRDGPLTRQDLQF